MGILWKKPGKRSGCVCEAVHDKGHYHAASELPHQAGRKNIPAKSMFGIVVSESANPLHAWPEAYLKKQGWVRFDPTSGHSEIEQDGVNYKMHISNKYVTLSEGRNDPELRTSLYYYNYNSTSGSLVKIKASFDISGGE